MERVQHQLLQHQQLPAALKGKDPECRSSCRPQDHHVGSSTWGKKAVAEEEDFVSERQTSRWINGMTAVSGVELQNEK